MFGLQAYSPPWSVKKSSQDRGGALAGAPNIWFLLENHYCMKVPLTLYLAKPHRAQLCSLCRKPAAVYKGRRKKVQAK